MSFRVFDTVISVWLIIFVAWGLPLTHYRSRFRKIVYPENKYCLKMRNFYSFYLILYTLLFVVYRFVG